MSELIILKDSSAVRRSIISRAVWQERERTKEKYLEVVFSDPALKENSSRSWELIDDEALDFWEQFTGQGVSWDERPTSE